MSEFARTVKRTGFSAPETNLGNSPNRVQDRRSPVRIKRTSAASRADFLLTPDRREALSDCVADAPVSCEVVSES